GETLPADPDRTPSAHFPPFQRGRVTTATTRAASTHDRRRSRIPRSGDPTSSTPSERQVSRREAGIHFPGHHHGGSQGAEASSSAPENRIKSALPGHRSERTLRKEFDVPEVAPHLPVMI